MVRNMDGQGLRMTRYPPEPSGTGLPSSVTTSGTTPKNGLVAEPGLVAIAPRTGEIIMAPVSVCHHVSTIGQRSWPIVSRYHIHASGLMGSPTVPRSRNESILCLLGQLSPHLINVRIAVGAV